MTPIFQPTPSTPAPMRGADLDHAVIREADPACTDTKRRAALRHAMGAACLALGLMSAGAVHAGPVLFDGGWKEQGFPFTKANSYRQGGARLDVASDASVSLLYRRLSASEHDSTSAAWKWAVTDGVPPTDLTRKGGDDRDLALYFVFVPEDQAASLETAGLRKLLGNSSSRALVYVRGGKHAAGQVLPSPYMGKRGVTIVLRGSGTGAAAEKVDLAADYRRAFGGAPGKLMGLAVSADSDDTDTRIRASLEGLRLN